MEESALMYIIVIGLFLLLIGMWHSNSKTTKGKALDALSMGGKTISKAAKGMSEMAEIRSVENDIGNIGLKHLFNQIYQPSNCHLRLYTRYNHPWMKSEEISL